MLTSSSKLRHVLNFTLKTHGQSQSEICTSSASVGNCPEMDTGHEGPSHPPGKG